MDIKNIIIDEILKQQAAGKITIEQAAKALAAQSTPCDGLVVDGKALEVKELDKIKDELRYFGKAYERLAKRKADEAQYYALKAEIKVSLTKYMKDTLQAMYPKETQETLYKIVSACIMDTVEPVTKEVI